MSFLTGTVPNLLSHCGEMEESAIFAGLQMSSSSQQLLHARAARHALHTRTRADALYYESKKLKMHARITGGSLLRLFMKLTVPVVSSSTRRFGSTRSTSFCTAHTRWCTCVWSCWSSFSTFLSGWQLLHSSQLSPTSLLPSGTICNATRSLPQSSLLNKPIQLFSAAYRKSLRSGSRSGPSRVQSLDLCV